MRKANRWFDPKLGQLKAHGAHHQGSIDHELVDMPLKNCLLLTSPSFLVLGMWGVAIGQISSVIIPAAALLSWSFCYTYLWTRIHRAIRGLETNWFFRLGPTFRFFRNHHLNHHDNAKMNYGTVSLGPITSSSPGAIAARAAHAVDPPINVSLASLRSGSPGRPR